MEAAQAENDKTMRAYSAQSNVKYQYAWSLSPLLTLVPIYYVFVFVQTGKDKKIGEGTCEYGMVFQLLIGNASRAHDILEPSED